TRSQLAGEGVSTALAASARTGRGSRETQRQSAGPATWRLYPPKTSSPPSPDRHTVTCRRAADDTRCVGSADGSGNGSSYSVASSGTAVSASLAESAISVWFVPRYRATDRACADSS